MMVKFIPCGSIPGSQRFDGYMKVNEQFSDDVVKFDANRTPEEIIEEITNYIEKLVK